MSIIKRIATTLHARVDQTVASIENHDAVVQTTLKDQQRSVAKAVVKLRHLETTAQQQQNNINHLKQRIDTWNTRAKSIAESDKEKALDCLVQRQADQRLLDIALKEQTNHSSLLSHMRGQVMDLQQRVSDMKSKYTDMQMRDTVVNAKSQLEDTQLSSKYNINDTFERWEVSLEAREMQSESHNKPTNAPLNLDDEFKLKENQQNLQDELEALLKATP